LFSCLNAIEIADLNYFGPEKNDLETLEFKLWNIYNNYLKIEIHDLMDEDPMVIGTCPLRQSKSREGFNFQ